MKKQVIFIVGPTAVGKTAVAFFLAKKINAEVISCDSMQVYQKMDILTSKPGPALRKRVPHHLIGTIDPRKEYNVSRYRADALKEISAVMKKGKTPLFVGGTGLYMAILIDGIFKIKKPAGKIRAQLYAQAEKKGAVFLYERLVKVDPQAAEKIHPHDTRRIIRALEVYKATGKPISVLQKQRKGLWDKHDVRIFCLNLPRELLYRRIERRLEQMFRQGVVNEVKKLLRLSLSKTASYAIGIKEIKGYLDGEYDLAAAKALIKRNTCLYAKRQLTWFRKDKRIKWLELDEKELPGQIAERIWKELY